ncbi:hypothetical protein R3P38DRAFT_2524452 [Favolaschia claudopus]|uniref:Uncharacterized protein n=1 Tax=Favolaschia claudopus TaxID=2862362 RepID=A0AAW0BTC0_9AGAR
MCFRLPVFLRRQFSRARKFNKGPTIIATDRSTFCAEETESHSSPGAGKAGRTAWNAFSLALTTLSSVSSQIPLATPLSGIIESVLNLAGRIEQTTANAAGFTQLASRIELLTPVVKDMAENNPNKGQVLVEKLETEMLSMKEDFETAKTEGRLARFLNSGDNMATIAKHNTTLAQLIADSTLATTAEVLKHLRESENSKVQGSLDPEGGYGGIGGTGRIGGAGGSGEGPQLDADPNDKIRVGNVSGGTGGAGGTGIDQGGIGGIGKGPALNLRRNRFLTAVGPAQT